MLAARFNHNGQYCLTCGKDRTVRFVSYAYILMLGTLRCAREVCEICYQASIRYMHEPACLAGIGMNSKGFQVT